MAEKLTNKEIIEKIIEVIESLRIYINQDGGDLEFIEYKNKFVYIKILGACVGCSLIDTTYNDGLEQLLKDEIGDEYIDGIKIINDEAI